jgi:hypothetical protein
MNRLVTFSDYLILYRDRQYQRISEPAYKIYNVQQGRDLEIKQSHRLNFLQYVYTSQPPMQVN